ncbi:MAG: hypothetical protein GXP40_08960 [Chloroflexi bacterium]|nr:hypothetical protein [Chloroflexota bacterium]
MSSSHRYPGRVFLVLTTLTAMLACTLLGPTTANPPAFDPTKAALELQATAMALQLTQSALSNQGAPTQPPPAPAIPTQVQPTPTQDVEARIRSAKILVYEDTDALGIGMWIRDALDGMGLSYTHVSDYIGDFMENLNSGIKWDLIIVGAESKSGVQGEFWDAINKRLTRDKVALIAEIWYLDLTASGPISTILSGCGIRFQKDWPLAESIYWLVPDHPVFNEPNTVLPLLHYNQYWANQAGDQIRLAAGSNATLLAGRFMNETSQEALLATCYDGRVIIQTFSNHDYHKSDIVPLWQNYIHYTLKNHFAVVP